MGKCRYVCVRVCVCVCVWVGGCMRVCVRVEVMLCTRTGTNSTFSARMYVVHAQLRAHTHFFPLFLCAQGLMGALDIPMEEVVAFGDGNNDVEMLEVC